MAFSILRGCAKGMTNNELTIKENELVGRCLYEAANGEYFPSWEFDTLIGADRAAVRRVASSWLTDQRISDAELGVTLSVLNNLLGYPHGREAELERAIGAQVSEVKSLFARLDG
jgi:hypothetical protein